MVAIERLMGMLLTAVAVQMFINGMKEAYGNQLVQNRYEQDTD